MTLTISVKKDGKEVEKIDRKPFGISCMNTNFNPLYARYKRKIYLIRSEEGDLSDPFRREDAGKFWIKVDDREDFNRLPKN